tara:strand:- start:20 stop:931 length:912 start_codon:yes stop_codon:yes gene_type:complete
MDNEVYIISDEVSSALKNNKPIVALESTLISHGLPYPENYNVAISSIKAVKENGSVPATIAIINGKIKIGLNESEIKHLAQNNKVDKVSKHNLEITLANKNDGSTTVASTLFIASQIGIKFLSTGGIGGVHLEAQNSFDISSDLDELTRSNIFVVCSGAKSILDLQKTYERLETLGIPRIGFKTDYMPGFWYYQTDKKLDHNFNNINELVNYLKIVKKIKSKGSVLIFNTVPKNIAVKKNNIDEWINKSMKEAETKSISGNELTPFLINKINLLSNNKTLQANTSLIINNAKLASKLAYYFTN